MVACMWNEMAKRLKRLQHQWWAKTHYGDFDDIHIHIGWLTRLHTKQRAKWRKNCEKFPMKNDHGNKTHTHSCSKKKVNLIKVLFIFSWKLHEPCTLQNGWEKWNWVEIEQRSIVRVFKFIHRKKSNVGDANFAEKNNRRRDTLLSRLYSYLYSHFFLSNFLLHIFSYTYTHTRVYSLISFIHIATLPYRSLCHLMPPMWIKSKYLCSTKHFMRHKKYVCVQ